MVALLLTFAEAEEVWKKLHDHWTAMSGSAPFERDDMAWSDIVQRVLFEARNALASREPTE